MTTNQQQNLTLSEEDLTGKFEVHSVSDIDTKIVKCLCSRAFMYCGKLKYKDKTVYAIFNKHREIICVMFRIKNKVLSYVKNDKDGLFHIHKVIDDQGRYTQFDEKGNKIQKKNAIQNIFKT